VLVEKTDKKVLTKSVCGDILIQMNIQTVDAEIKAIMTSQRACGAGMQVRNSLSNGPRRALSKI